MTTRKLKSQCIRNDGVVGELLTFPREIINSLTSRKFLKRKRARVRKKKRKSYRNPKACFLKTRLRYLNS